jgi:hypothetical protein
LKSINISAQHILYGLSRPSASLAPGDEDITRVQARMFDANMNF